VVHHVVVPRPLYVETLVRADLERVWQATQDAHSHSRWDLRFSRIEDITAQVGSNARIFRYALRLPGRTIAGTGTSVGEKWRPDGTRFLTGYDYEPGWGAAGRTIDRVVFRRLLGWATAWSFDRLRLWLDDGVPPESATRRAAGDLLLRAAAVGIGVTVVGRGPRRGGTATLAASALVASALTAAMPPLPGAPRAGRCRRRPPHAVDATAPATLARLREPT
jgi:hypothetical protein